jgi:hypothetical protein
VREMRRHVFGTNQLLGSACPRPLRQPQKEKS